MTTLMRLSISYLIQFISFWGRHGFTFTKLVLWQVRRRETNYEQLIKCAGAFPDFDASRRILKRILEETVKTDFEEAFGNGLTEALCANNRKMTQYFLSRRNVKATFMVVVLKTRQVTYRKERMRWSAVPSDQFKRTEVSSKDANTITIDQVRSCKRDFLIRTSLIARCKY